MEGVNCHNFSACRLVTIKGFGGDEQKRQQYVAAFCTGGEPKWSTCTRLTVKKALNFCPDFVFPDTDMTPDEVIDKFDELNQSG